MAADNCDSDVTIEILSNTQVSGSCAGTVLRTYKATDDCGNSTEFQQIIDLLDEVAPVLTITCPGNADLTADASCSADTSLDALGTATYTAMDNCDDELEISLTPCRRLDGRLHWQLHHRAYVHIDRRGSL